MTNLASIAAALSRSMERNITERARPTLVQLPDRTVLLPPVNRLASAPRLDTTDKR